MAIPRPSKHGRLNGTRVMSPEDWWQYPAPVTRESRGDGENATNHAQAPSGPASSFPCRLIGEWRVGQVLGKGSAGSVRLARSIIDSSYAAIKSCKRSSNDWRVIVREITMLKLACHPHIVGLLDVYETTTSVLLVMEYCPLGTLYSLITRVKLSDGVVRRLFGQIVAALAHLHSLSIAHRDIKAENILLFTDDQRQLSIKLGDLGMSTAHGAFLATSCGSPHYVAPEVISGKHYNGMQADVWSAGVVLFAMLCRRLPFEAKNVPELLNQIRRADYAVDDHLDCSARDLILSVLVKDPSKRLTMREIQHHEYFRHSVVLSTAFRHQPLANDDQPLDADIIEDLSLVLEESPARIQCALVVSADSLAVGPSERSHERSGLGELNLDQAQLWKRFYDTLHAFKYK